MFYKIYLKNYQECYPHVVAGSLEVLPNAFGGLRSLRVGKIDTFWTGIYHLHFSKDSSFDIQLTGVRSVYCRSTLNETDECWACLLDEVEHPISFHYEKYASIAEELETRVEEIDNHDIHSDDCPYWKRQPCDCWAGCA